MMSIVMSGKMPDLFSDGFNMKSDGFNMKIDEASCLV